MHRDRVLAAVSLLLLSTAASCTVPPSPEPLVSAPQVSLPQEPSPLAYRLQIPSNVPRRYTVSEKGGARRDVDGHAIYADAHRDGWDECLSKFFDGQLDLNDTSDPLLFYQETALSQQARLAGFQQCRSVLRERVRDLGRDAVRAELATRGEQERLRQ